MKNAAIQSYFAETFQLLSEERYPTAISFSLLKISQHEWNQYCLVENYSASNFAYQTIKAEKSGMEFFTGKSLQVKT